MPGRPAAKKAPAKRATPVKRPPAPAGASVVQTVPSTPPPPAAPTTDLPAGVSAEELAHVFTVIGRRLTALEQRAAHPSSSIRTPATSDGLRAGDLVTYTVPDPYTLPREGDPMTAEGVLLVAAYGVVVDVESDNALVAALHAPFAAVPVSELTALR